MRVGTLVSVPSVYSRFGRIVDASGASYTVEASQVPEDAQAGDDFAYRVEIWENDSGLAYDLEED